MKRTFTSALLLAGCLSLSAQYLPNEGFENWKGSCGSSLQTSSPAGERQRPGDEPSDWSGSSVNQQVSIFSASGTLISKTTGYTGSGVNIQNVWVGKMGVGATAPGFITLGTPWVYAATSGADGGVYGGMSFTNRPDAITGRFKRTDSNDENSHIIAYLWKGTFKSGIKNGAKTTQEADNVDRAVLGRETPTTSGTLIAKCDYTFKSTNSEWQEITVPLEYVSGQESVDPEMVNVIIAGGDYWTRGNLKENTTLVADDVQFVYYHALNSITYNGTTYDVAEGTTTYTIKAEEDGTIDMDKLSYSVKGVGASVIVSSYNTKSHKFTIAVKGNDYAKNSKSITRYTINVDQSTAINNATTTSSSNNEVYSLQGIRQDASKKLQKGIYVKDGKKVLVK